MDVSEELIRTLDRMIDPPAGQDKTVSMQTKDYRVEISPHHGVSMSPSAVQMLIDDHDRLTRERDELRKTVERLTERYDVAESDYSFLVESYNEATAERDEGVKEFQATWTRCKVAERERDEAAYDRNHFRSLATEWEQHCKTAERERDLVSFAFACFWGTAIMGFVVFEFIAVLWVISQF